jgi:phosphomannomutase
MLLRDIITHSGPIGRYYGGDEPEESRVVTVSEAMLESGSQNSFREGKLMSIFKAYDIRGEYPGQLDEKMAFAIGLAVADIFQPERVAIGRDGRVSGEPLEAAIVDALLKSGCDVVDLGLVSTPVVYYYAGSQKSPLGLVVTASHNPAQDNGLKICHDGALPVTPEQIQSIGSWVEQFESKGRSAPQERSGSYQTVDPFPDYVRFIRSFAKFRPGFRMVVDAANGVCGDVVPKVFEGLDVEMFPLYFEVDGRFPNHEPNPLKPETTEVLRKLVVERRCDLGVALDGDGDRVMFIDEHGEYLPSDMLGLLLALDVLEREPPRSKIVVDTRASKAFVEVLTERGAEVIRGRVGHSLVKAKIHEIGAVFGAELSGHFYFRETFFAENSDFAVVSMLNLLTRLGRPLSALVKENNRYFQSGEINFDVADKDGMMESVRRHYSDAKISFIDGLTVEYPTWWFNVRPSNTEDILRLNLEADAPDELESRVKEVAELIKRE